LYPPPLIKFHEHFLPVSLALVSSGWNQLPVGTILGI
jgi:hypothetical protein